ncbi:MAG: hypothetical protein VX731_04665, partial [Candidatus Neomarinimicrobiota bacterium]|nr:hypothetical protein [Candidatus Neomarinimicrobiota bacterium]
MIKKKLFLTLSIFIVVLYSQNNDRRIINTVSFINNLQIDSNDLEGQIELKPPSILRFNSLDFDRRLLKLDAINIKNHYNSNGFLQATVKDS